MRPTAPVRISLFYPLSFALIAAMVLYALKPGLDRVQEWRRVVASAASEGLTFDGDMLETLVATERANVAFEGEDGDRIAIIGSSGVIAQENGNGVHYFVPADAVRALGGGELEVAFEVRSEVGDDAQVWLARVVLPGETDTGWIEMSAGADWSRQRLTLQAPAGRQRESMDVIIWPDALGDRGRLELRRIAVAPIAAPR